MLFLDISLLHAFKSREKQGKKAFSLCEILAQKMYIHVYKPM